MSQAILWYFADPMCSWCWGFSPVINQIKKDYHNKLQIALNLGGLRPGTTEAITDELRQEILHHWHEVHKLSAQEFNFEKAMPEGFVYDTEPASRALVAFGKINTENTLALFHDIQYAFYVEQRDVTQQNVLANLVSKFNINEPDFLEEFLSPETKEQTQQHFKNTRQAGVLGFPTLVFQHEKQHLFLSRGFATYPQIKQQLDSLLKKVL